MVEVAVLEEVAEIFASLRDVDSALARFLELVRSVAGTGLNGAIYLRDGGTGNTFLRWRENPETPALHLPAALVEGFFAGVDHRAVSFDEPGFADIPAIARAREGGIHAALGLPMRHGGRVVGLVGLGFPSLDALPAPKLRALAALARFPAAAIEHARTQELVDRRARHADLLRRFGERALGTLDVAALHRLILDTTVELTGSDQASITEVHGDVVRVVAGVGKDAALVGSEGPAAAVREALGSDEPYVVHDVATADPAQRLVRMARRFEAGSFMALAMRHETRVFGHVFAGAAAPRAYRAETVEAMRILASMAAAMLEQRSAQAEAQRQAGRLAAAIEHLPIFIEVYDSQRRARARQRHRAADARALRRAPTPTAQRCCGDLTVTLLDGTPVVPEELPPALALRGQYPQRREVVALARRPEAGDGADGGGADLRARRRQRRVGGAGLPGHLGAARAGAGEGSLPERRGARAAHAADRAARHDAADRDRSRPRSRTRRAATVVLARIRRQTERLVRLVGQLLDSVRGAVGRGAAADAPRSISSRCAATSSR